MARWPPAIRSVRAKLLLLVLLPLAILLPALIALIVYWGNAAYDRLLIYKINAELVIAHQYLERAIESRLQTLTGLARSAGLAAAIADRGSASRYLATAANREGFDFLGLVDLGGNLLATSTAQPVSKPVGYWPVVAGALEGKAAAGLDILQPDVLEEMSPELAARARLRVIQTPSAAFDDKLLEARGMIVHAAAPVIDGGGKIIGALEAGVLLNRNLDFVDNINSIIYTEAALPLGSRGTVTLFLDDVRIATNVRMFGAADDDANQLSGPAMRGSSSEQIVLRDPTDRSSHGDRALGTRVSLAVRDKVLGEGKVWLDRAFVVNDWYVSGYEPLRDSFGKRIGMLYVGYLEAPFSQIKRNILASIIALFAVIAAVVAVLSLRRARAVFRPLERMDATMGAVVAGDASARVGSVGSEDEIGRLALHLDRLLDTLDARSRELRELNAELDQKVVGRTRELAQANEELKAAQQKLVRSEKLAAIGQLTAGVAHEINNPIAVMQGNLDVMREALGSRGEIVGTEIRLLDEQINRIRLIVTKLLQFARPDEFAGYVEEVDVNAVVSDSLVLVRPELRKANINVRQELQGKARVRINRIELQQVLINLMVNALYAMESGGTITLSTADWREGVHLRGVRIDIQDTGCGIGEEAIGRVFDPFFTTKRQHGTGLGLSISLSLVDRYGGTITVDSHIGEGSCFSVWLLAEPLFNTSPDA